MSHEPLDEPDCESTQDDAEEVHLDDDSGEEVSSLLLLL